jgi:hypothetical protein
MLELFHIFLAFLLQYFLFLDLFGFTIGIYPALNICFKIRLLSYHGSANSLSFPSTIALNGVKKLEPNAMLTG